VIYIQWDLGLADAIVCNAIVRAKAEVHEQVIVPSSLEGLVTVAAMFRDLPNVQVFPVTGEGHLGEAFDVPPDMLLALGHWGPGWRPGGDDTYDQAYYRQARVEFGRRWRGWAVQRDVPRECDMLYSDPVWPQWYKEQEPYLVVHDTPAERIDPAFTADQRLVRVRLGPDVNLWDYWLLVANAQAVHVIDGPVSLWVDSVSEKPELYLHRYMRKSSCTFCLPVYNRTWEVIG
jgi:hypothetical protein